MKAVCCQIVEYALTLTNGSDNRNVVPMAERHPLIKSWVFIKQMLSQAIPKNLGHDDDVSMIACPVTELI